MEDFNFPGWESRWDPRTNRFYFVDLFNKMTTWDDPRIKYRSQLQSQGTPSHVSSEAGTHSQMHGSPYHVYPASSSIYPAQAFQNPPSGIPSVNASPFFGVKQQHHNQQMEMSSMRSNPATPRVRQNQQETSFTLSTDQTVQKINSMFPTVDENHIRLLLKKYHNREAVVISALQVEKHPLTTPGPYTTPPLTTRHFHTTAMGIVSAFQMTPQSYRRGGTNTITTGTGTSSNGSPIPPRPNSCASGSYYGYYGYYGSPRFSEHVRGSPKPHSSPKMKLRYLKSMYQKADETVILEVLASCDNNVQKASEQLKRMGFEKRDTASAPKVSNRQKDDKTPKKVAQPTPPPKIKSVEEKKRLKAHLQSQYKDIAERIISMALESVDYSEDKACKILDIVKQEDIDKVKDTKKKSDKKKGKDGETAEKNVSFKENSPGKQLDDEDDDDAEDSDGEIEEDTLIINSDNEALLTKKSNESDNDTLNDGTSTAQLLSPISDKTNHHHLDSPYSTSSNDSTDGKNRFVRYNLSNQKHSRPKAKKDAKHVVVAADIPIKSGTDENLNENDFRSVYSKLHVKGHNPKLAKGPNDEILLADYVTWNGANPDLSTGRKNLAKGPNTSLRAVDRCKPCGSNKDIFKGPKNGLAKGSMYSQINRPLNDVVCN